MENSRPRGLHAAPGAALDNGRDRGGGDVEALGDGLQRHAAGSRSAELTDLLHLQGGGGFEAGAGIGAAIETAARTSPAAPRHDIQSAPEGERADLERRAKQLLLTFPKRRGAGLAGGLGEGWEGVG